MKASLGTMKAGKLGAAHKVAARKVAGQRTVLAVFDVESRDELGQITVGELPLAHDPEIAGGARNRWEQTKMA